MEKLEADIEGKVKLLIFTLGKTQGIQHSGSVLALTRHHEALNTIVKQIDSLKLQVVEERFKRGDSDDDITKWSAEIDNHVAQVDTKVTLLNEHLASIKLEEDLRLKIPKGLVRRRSARISLNLNVHSLSRNWNLSAN